MVRSLAADTSVDSVIGVARRRPELRAGPKVTWQTADISTDDLDLVAGADVVVHLA